MKIILAITTIFLMWAGSPLQGYAASGEWTVTITVSTPYATVPGGTASATLAAGVRNGASAGYDNAVDTVSLLEPDDPVQVHFPHGAIGKDSDGDGALDGWECPDPETGYNSYQCSLWRDFRGLRDEETWAFEILSPLNGTTVSLDWRIEGDPADLAKIEPTLVDLDASTFSPPFPPQLGQTYHYSYTNFFSSGKKYGIKRFEIRAKTTGLFITPEMLPPGTLNAPYHETLRVIGGTWGGIGVWGLVEGSLPPGLLLDVATGWIEGTSLGEGSYSFTVVVADSAAGLEMKKDFSLVINPSLTITMADLPGGQFHDLYKAFVEVKGGTPPYRWRLVSGSLPDGLSLGGEEGIITGYLQVPGIFDFQVQVEDAANAGAVKDYRITVIEPEDAKPPDTITDFRALYLISTSVILSWTAPGDDSLTGSAAAYDLRYSNNCSNPGDPAWWDSAIQAAGEPRPQLGTLHTYTLSGLEVGKGYCAAIQSMDASGNVSGISNIVYFPEGVSGIGSGGSNLVTRQTLLTRGYNLISIPLIPLPNDLSIFADDVGNPVTLYRWYSAYPGLIESQWYLENAVQPGYGYFLYAMEQGPLDVTGLEISDAQTPVRLQGGWNMVGNPYGSDVVLKDVRIQEIGKTAEGITKPFEEAAKAGWVGNALYAFTGLGYVFLAVNDDPPAVLKPWQGFWVYAKENGNYEMIFWKP